MNMFLMIISIILANGFSVYEVANNPSNMQLILCINIFGNIAIFTIYWINIQRTVKEALGLLENRLNVPLGNLKPLEKIFVSKGMTKDSAMHFEEMFGEDGWSEEIESPKNGDLYLAISEYKKNEKNMLGLTAVIFNASDNTWYAMNKKTHEFVAIEDIICFKSLESLPEAMQEKFTKGINNG